MTLFIILVIIVLLSFSAFLSAAETSFFSLSSYTVDAYKGGEDQRHKMIAKLLSHPRELLVTIMIMNIFCSILIQNAVSNLYANTFSWLLKVGLPFILILFFGEILPKSIALMNNKAIAYRIAPFLKVASKILGPFRLFLTKFTGYISKILFFFLRKDQPLSTEEIELILSSSRESGILSSDEYEFIDGYFNLHKVTAKEVMVPKEEILFYNINDPISKLLSMFVDKKLSKIPVCNNSLDKLIGIISARRFFFYQDKISDNGHLPIFLKSPFFIPESTKAFMLFSQLREKDESIAIVVDEYGSIIGMVREEDLVKQLVGALKEEGREYSRAGQNEIIASGKLGIDEFESIFDVKLKRKLNSTIGGWLIEQMEDIPQAGQKYYTERFLFYVLSSSPNKVKRIYVRKLK